MYQYGLAMIVVGIVLLVAEALDPGFFIAIPGGVLVVLGIMAIAVPSLVLTIWSPIIVGAVVVILLLVTMKFYQNISPPTTPITTGSDSLRGQKGKVVQKIDPDDISGKVRIDNQTWSATADEEIEEGTKVVVTKSEGVHVVVKELKEVGKA